MARILEIACFNLESAIIAQAAGADRVELCEGYASGGVTPSHEIILQLKAKLQIPLHVIIRPRGGDFNYSATEIEQMKKDILFCKEHNVNGVVFGCLNEAKEIDAKICEELLELARPMTVTFHRAIDECKNIKEGLESLISMAFDRVLTSGGKNNALEGKDVLKELSDKYFDTIIVLPGGGIRSTNISEIIKAINCSEYHSAALLNNSELCDESEIKKMKTILNSF